MSNVVPAGPCVSHGVSLAGEFYEDAKSPTGWSFRCERGCYFQVARTRTDILKYISDRLNPKG